MSGPSPPAPAPAAQGGLEAWRRRLLDLTRRNRLLAFRATRRTTVTVHGESPAELFRLLALEGRSLGFVADPTKGASGPRRRRRKAGPEEEEPVEVEAPGPALAEPGKGAPPAEAPPASPAQVAEKVVVAAARCPFCHDLVGEAGAAVCEACLARHHAECWDELGQCASCGARGALVKAPAPPPPAEAGDATWRRVARDALGDAQKDHALQTALGPDDLQANLVAIHRASTSLLEEQGFNALFLALGFLEWTEPGKPDELLRAPVLLVPVELRRGSLRAQFKLQATDDDALVNPALAWRLEQSHGKALPALPDDLEAWDPDDLYEQVAALAKDVPGWRLTTDVALALFSFTKLVMYQDLKQHEELVLAHPTCRKLLGLPPLAGGGTPAAGEAKAPVSDRPAGSPGDSRPRTSSPRAVGGASRPPPADGGDWVLDADQSQREAIEAALAGRDLVLEGPPGTGKSQTITNLVGAALARGKSVLFVSEKMAALEVVQARLEATGLGPFCLELHSRKAHKRALADALRKTLELEPPPDHAEDDALEAAAGHAARLDAHARELHAPWGALQRTPWSVLGELERVPAVAQATAAAGLLEEPRRVEQWTAPDLEAREAALERLARRLAQLGLATWPALVAHPLHGVGRTSLDRAAEAELQEALVEVRDGLLPAARAAAEAVARRVGLEPPATPEAGRHALDLAALLRDPLLPDAAVLEGSAWETAKAADALLELRARTGELRKKIAETFAKDAELQEPLALADTIEKTGAAWYRVFVPSWWSARGAVNAALRTDRPPPEPAAQALALRLVARARELEGQLEERKAEAEALFGGHWSVAALGRSELEQVGALARRFREHAKAGRAGPGVRAALRRSPWSDAEKAALEKDAAAAEAALQALATGWGRFARAAAFDTVAALGAPQERAAWPDVAARLDGVEAARPQLPDWVDLQRDLAEARALALLAFVERLLGGGPPSASGSNKREPLAPDRLPAALRRAFLERWLDRAAKERKAIAGFDRLEHERALEAFAKLDARRLHLVRARLRHQLAARRPDASWAAAEGSELGLLQRELRKKRGHLPVRQLLQRMPALLPSLKPCLLMSPLSVAQFLDPAVHRFDLVVFDEASQIAPEDALGAILRGERVVVVGDSRQLPPTPFFAGAAAAEAPGATDDLESILDECAARGLERRMLRWHYRSRHESLIAFSNRHVYEGRLVSFPSPGDDEGRLGLKLVRVEQGRYDRGGSGKNLAEAEAVADAVVAHLRAHPDRSLGVGTFSAAQQEAIQDALDARLRREGGGLEQHLGADREEHVFVKNLENLQGDERDVIFISIGYGPDAAGKLSLNFGPLNQSGGERRLNVLVTRAREQVVVFCSFAAEAIDPTRTTSQGVRLLRGYLEHAERAQAGLAAAGDGVGERDALIESVRGALQAALDARRPPGDAREPGWRIDRDVGATEARLDLAVRAPGQEAGWLVGLTVDGPRYARFPHARDRDRLLPDVLRGLGWRLARVWALDWQRRRARVLEELLAAVDAAKAEAAAERVRREVEAAEAAKAAVDAAARGEAPAAEVEAAPAVEAEAGEAAPVLKVKERPVATGIQPYRELEVRRLGDAGDLERAGRQVVDLVRQVVELEGPIHDEELQRRVLAHWETTRSGKRGRQLVDEAVATTIQGGRARREGEFVWPAQLKEPPVRDRSQAGPREAEHIPPGELEAALLLVARKEFRLPADALVTRAAKLLGFPRAGAKLKATLVEAVERLVEKKRLIDDGASIALPR